MPVGSAAPGFDAVLVGGRVLTPGRGPARAMAVGIRDGRVVSLGDDAAVLAGAAADAEVVDLRGKVVMPGFIDGHAHPVAAGIESLECDVTAARDGAETLAAIAVYAREHPDREWIAGGGWTMHHFAGGAPTRHELDGVIRDRPVALMNADHHGMWVNSEALRRAGVDASTPDPADGRIEREPDGTPAGTLHEGAAELVRRVMPGPSAQHARDGLLAAQDHLFSLGIVGWVDAFVGRTAGLDDLLDVYLDAVERRVLRARVSAALWWERERGTEQIESLMERRARVRAAGAPDVLTAETVKIMVDGVAESFTAALSMPYRDAHGCVTDNSGLLFLEPEALKRAVVALDAQGFDAHFHALGDHAVTVALDAIEAAYVDHGRRPGARHTLAHLQVVSTSDVARFRDLGAVANLQMLWACVDEALDELTFPFIDESLVGRHYRFAELADEGVALAAGSDWPVSSAAPFEAVAVAMARAERGSRPDPRIDPAQTIPAEVALAAYTRGSAQLLPGYQGGAVEVGRPADLIVVPEDPTVLPADEVAGLEVEQTWVGGRPVFRRS